MSKLKKLSIFSASLPCFFLSFFFDNSSMVWYPNLSALSLLLLANILFALDIPILKERTIMYNSSSSDISIDVSFLPALFLTNSDILSSKSGSKLMFSSASWCAITLWSSLILSFHWSVLKLAGSAAADIKSMDSRKFFTGALSPSGTCLLSVGLVIRDIRLLELFLMLFLRTVICFRFLFSS